VVEAGGWGDERIHSAAGVVRLWCGGSSAVQGVGGRGYYMDGQYWDLGRGRRYYWRRRYRGEDLVEITRPDEVNRVWVVNGA
jgi:hypothetical protein